MMLISVVLPAPFGPSRPKNSPSATARLHPGERLQRAVALFDVQGFDGEGHGGRARGTCCAHSRRLARALSQWRRCRRPAAARPRRRGGRWWSGLAEGWRTRASRSARLASRSQASSSASARGIELADLAQVDAAHALGDRGACPPRAAAATLASVSAPLTTMRSPSRRIISSPLRARPRPRSRSSDLFFACSVLIRPSMPFSRTRLSNSVR